MEYIQNTRSRRTSRSSRPGIQGAASRSAGAKLEWCYGLLQWSGAQTRPSDLLLAHLRKAAPLEALANRTNDLAR